MYPMNVLLYREAKFPLGQIAKTIGIADEVSDAEIMDFLRRHQSGDWGDCCSEDASRNDEALIEGDRVLSVYHSQNGTKIWIITEWDRSYTTVLLPSEY